MMATITIAMQKGGCGKSTLARHGSVILPRSALLDLDPQGTTMRWLDRRRENGAAAPAAIKASFARAGEAVERVKSHPQIQHLIIDTPPEHDDQRTIRFAISVADYVVLPCKPSPDDLEVLRDTLKLVIGARKPFGIVLTMVRPGSRTLVQAQELLTKAATAHGGELCPVTMGNRVAYTDSVFFAKTVTEFEPNGAAAEEMTGIWTWVGNRAVAAARRAKDG